MRFEIWQLPTSNPNKFMHLDWCKVPVDIRDYVMVYTGEEESDTENCLEELFYIFNQEHPDDYHAASMSVSDLVCLIDSNNERNWWYVDGVGFERVEPIPRRNTLKDYRDYQIEWLKNNIKLDDKTEKLIIDFLLNTEDNYEMEW